jgi:hypothetical protein
MPPAIEAAPAMDGAPHFWKDGEDVLFDKTTIYVRREMRGARRPFHRVFLT